MQRVTRPWFSSMQRTSDIRADDRACIDSGADAGEGDDHLEEAAHEHASVGAGAEDPVRWFFTEQ